MSKTESLNSIFVEFCDDLINVFPELRDKIVVSRDRVKENITTGYYLDYFVRHILGYMLGISRCDVDYCLEKNFTVAHGVNFRTIWTDSLTVSSKHAIWRYLHTFYLLSHGNSKFEKVVNKCKEKNIENYSLIAEAFENHDEILKNIMSSSARFAEDILKEQLNDDEATDESGEVDGDGEGVEGGEGGKGGEGGEGGEGEGGDGGGKRSGRGRGRGRGGNPFLNVNESEFEDRFLNSKIGNLAKEISEEINPNDLEGLKNPQDLFGSLMGGGDGNEGIGKLIKTVGDKLQNKMQSGEIDHSVLMNEATQMMSMLNPNLAKMMGGMGGMSGMGGGGGGLGGLGSMLSGMFGGGMGGGGGGGGGGGRSGRHRRRPKTKK